MDNPAAPVRQWKTEQGGGAIGFLLTDVPEELIHAAGFFPYGIVSGVAELEKANTHLQAWACSYSRSCLALGLGGELDFLDGLIIPQTCDTTRMLLDLWEQVKPFRFMDNFRLPRQSGRSSARNYLTSELDRLKQGLEQFSGRAIEIKKLKESIALYNSNRKLMRKIYGIHALKPSLLNSRELYTLINGAMIMPRERVNALLNQITESLESTLNGTEDKEHLRLLLSGTLLEPFEILDFIEEAGGTVVADDFQNGYRYIEADVNIGENLMAALADRQLNRIPSSAFDLERRPRRGFLTGLARENNVRGAIFLHLTFCEPENFDYYDNLQAMQKAGIPATRIETQFGRFGLGQMRTRINAFMEMVGGDSL